MPLVQAVRQLGMPLYMCQPPTGYADRAEAWVNTGALLNRMNFALALSSGAARRMRRGRRQIRDASRRSGPRTRRQRRPRRRSLDATATTVAQGDATRNRSPR